MSSELVLGPQELNAALAVLDREQAACMPTRRQIVLYRAFNIAVYLLAAMMVVVLAWLFSDIAMDEPDVVLGLLLLLCAATLGLFLANIGVMLKLWRHARLRRRLRLGRLLSPAFRAQRKASRAKNIVTIAIAVLGVPFTLFGVLLVVIALLDWVSPGLRGKTAHFESAVVLLITLAITLVGVALVALHFVRRGKERLELVVRLRQTLATQAAEPAQDGAAARLASDDYDVLVSMEREQIIGERASSIASGRREAAASSYLCQSSRQMTEAKSRLPTDLLAKVDDTVLGLLAEPAPANSEAEPQTGARLVAVADTPLRIRYDVDAGRHLVRLHELLGPTA